MKKEVNELKNIRSDIIILGFTGLIGSGCTYIANNIISNYGRYKYFSLSHKLKELLKKEKGINKPTVEQMQNFGNEKRAKYGRSYFVTEVLRDIDKRPDVSSLEYIIIDSIRNDFEVRALRQFPYFYLFSIHADEELQSKRTITMKKFNSSKKFQDAISRDRYENIPHGQQVIKCNDLADILINNNKDFADQAKHLKKTFIDNIYSKYVSLIELRRDGKLTPENLSTIEETFMTMAYAESQRSSCLKRKVGAIIASVRTLNQSPPDTDKKIKESAHVLSSGHNEVPFGTIPCIFHPDFQKCYRDHLQETQAKKIKHCPKCGKKLIPVSIICNPCKKKYSVFLKTCPVCKRELEIKYSCSNPNCKIEIFKEYLLSAGKLLDMCKALHAEENAILNLAKIGNKNGDNLVLYTTTYPCNLCANKIVASGIKKVIYADPYTIDEAKEILEKGGVTTEKFQGIKSLAFFKLYR